MNIANALATGTPALNAVNDTKQYTYNFNTAGSQAPITAQMTKGGVPEYCVGLQIDSFSLSIADIGRLC